MTVLATQTRVAIVEDHALVRAGVRALLDRLPWVEVVGEAGDGEAALPMIEDRQPSVLILDLTIPKVDGLHLLPILADRFPDLHVVVMSMHDDETTVSRAIRAGARGYLLKTASPADLDLAIRAVTSGGVYLSPNVSTHLTRRYRVDPQARSEQERLPPRQLEILRLIAEGHTNHDIAELLQVGVRTVETHRARLMERLGVHDVAGLVRFAVRIGVITPTD